MSKKEAIKKDAKRFVSDADCLIKKSQKDEEKPKQSDKKEGSK